MAGEIAREDPTKLTRFAAHDADIKASQSLFARLFQRDKANQNVKSKSAPHASHHTPQDEDRLTSNVAESQTVFYPTEESNEALTPSKKRAGVRDEMRTLKNVLGRIMNILDKKPSLNEGLRPYKDSDFRQSWMPDSACKECYDCSSKFTTFLRRHHCRICGQIFCSRCCNQEVPGRVIGFEGGLRACTYCCGVVSDLMDASDDDLGALRDNLKAQLSDSSSMHDLRGASTPSRRLSLSDEYDTRVSGSRINSVFDLAPTQENLEDMSHEERQTLVKDSAQLKTLFFGMVDPNNGVQRALKRHRLRTYHDCFYGHELINWLKGSDKAGDDSQAMVIGQALLDAKFVICMTDNSATFHRNDALYQFRELSKMEQRDLQVNIEQASRYEHDEQNWDISGLHGELDFSNTFGRSVSSTGTNDNKSSTRMNITDYNFDSDSKTNITPSPTPTPITPPQLTNIILDRGTAYGSNEQIHSAKEEIHNGVQIPTEAESLSPEQTSTEDHQTQIYNQFKIFYKDHMRSMCTQLLERNHLPLIWTDILLDLCSGISHFVRPDVRLNKDHMDISPYIHIKKVRSGKPEESAVTYGVICTKTVIHNKMKTSIHSPKIMLLESSVMYQRVTNKLTSLDPQILQEREYLQNCVARICKYKPDVLLVEQTVSRVAQQLLLEAGITVVINVKRTVMERVARLTMADIIPSTDSLINPPVLGTCYKFKTDIYRFHDGYYKTLMVFSGCPANLGCTVILRSQSYPELVKVKPILLMLVNAYYHIKLEVSYMVDQSTNPPTEKSLKDKKRHFSGDSRESRESEDTNSLHPQTEGVGSRDSTPQGSPRASPRLSLHGSTLTANQQSTTTQEHQQQTVTEPRRFRNILGDSILDYSPFVKIYPPYFETEKGKMSALRGLFSAQPYWSPLLTGAQLVAEETRTRGNNELYNHRMDQENIQSLTAELRDPHPFITWGVNCPVTSKPFKDLAARYRMGGARLVLKSGNFIEQQGGGTTINNDPDPVVGDIPPVVDCFDVLHHQRISVLFSSYTADNRSHSCVKPWIVHMDFYNKNDITLGHFLELYCFRLDLWPVPSLAELFRNDRGKLPQTWDIKTYKCPRQDCDIPMLEHIRRFVHESGSLYLIVKTIHEPPQDVINTNSPEAEKRRPDQEMTTWSWCRKCGLATPVVPLSPSTWHISFAKFLQIRLTCTLTGSQASPDCVHSVSKDYYQYFKYKDMVAVFKYSSITLREARFPSSQITIKHRITKNDVSAQVQIIHTHGLGLFSTVTESFHKLEANGLDTQGKKQVLKEHKEMLEKEKSWFTGEIDRIQTKLIEERLASSIQQQEKMTVDPDHSTLHQLEDELLKLKCHLSRAVQQWNIKIDRLNTKEDKGAHHEKKLVRAVTDGSLLSRPLARSPDFASLNIPRTKQDSIQSEPEKFSKVISSGSSNSDPKSLGPVSSHDPDGPVTSSHMELERKLTDSSISSQDSAVDPAALPSADYNLAHYHQIVNHGLRAGVRRSRTLNSADSVGSFEVCGNTPESTRSPPLSPLAAESIQTALSNGDDDTVTPLANTPQEDDIFNPSPESKSATGDVTKVIDTVDGSLIVGDDMDEAEDLDKFPTELDKRAGWVVDSESTLPLHHTQNPNTDDLTKGNSKHDDETSDIAGSLPNVESDHFTDKVDGNPMSGEKVDTSAVTMRFKHPVPGASSAHIMRTKRQRNLKKSSSRIFESMKTAILPSTDDSVVALVENPFSENEHYLLWPTLNVPIVVYDEEPSSIIAYTLGSSSYEDSLIEAQKQLMLEKKPVGSGSNVALPDKVDQHPQQEKRNEIETILFATSISSITAAMRSRNASPLTASGQSTPRSDTPPTHQITPPTRQKTPPINSVRVNTNSLSAAANRRSEGDQPKHDDPIDDVDQYRFGKPKDRNDSARAIQHLEIEFTENSVSHEKMAVINCKVYFAIDFKKLRRQIFAGGENEFIRSLRRCYKWNAKGGKSGLTFCKTKDERFIMKQMSRAEIQSFIEFGPSYFEYLTKSLSDKQAQKNCALARILGVYTLKLKNFQTNAEFEQDVLIIENLFYGHKISKTFDLKGSERNRLVNKEGQSGTVLLDENFMKYSKHSPIYVRAHTKKVLMETLFADSLFLADHTVMDYSLLCGIDKDTNELVIGIIDYIRTFTWDKKLETVFKSSVPNSKMPTIVSPKVYRTRFLEAMDRYFNVVPNRWTGLANDDC